MTFVDFKKLLLDADITLPKFVLKYINSKIIKGYK